MLTRTLARLLALRAACRLYLAARSWTPPAGAARRVALDLPRGRVLMVVSACHAAAAFALDPAKAPARAEIHADLDEVARALIARAEADHARTRERVACN